MSDAQDSSKNGSEQALYLPERDLAELFVDVQMAKVFSDTKTFVDCVPLEEPAWIVAAYRTEKHTEGFSLTDFVRQHFLPPAKIDAGRIGRGKDMVYNLKAHWSQLVRESKSTTVYHSLIDLPFPFVVPGGRFREMFYWDSYFTIIGLLQSREDKLALGMIRNFEYLVNAFGHIPNGNRTYFLSRSQPPFFAEMLKAYAQKHGMETVIEFLPALEKEYQYWTHSDKQVSANQVAIGKSVWLDGTILNRYTGTEPAPRAEAYNKEYNWAQAISEDLRPQFYLNLRAACESGWDFSSRWFADGKSRATNQCESLIPVCLNSLLYNCETELAAMYQYKADIAMAKKYEELANIRKKGIQKYCWSEEQGLFNDYQFVNRTPNPVISLAAVYPLYFGLATQQQADETAKMLEEKFLVEGGLVTTLNHSGEQWDAPNGWAPMQWLAVMGLHRYGHTKLAKNIATRWLKVNEAVYHSENKMMEKYNVITPSLPGGGGNYENQDGFGWTNGVAIALHAWLKGVTPAK